MRNLVTSNTRLAWPRAMRFAGVVAGLSIVGLRAARAQAVSGSVDPRLIRPSTISNTCAETETTTPVRMEAAYSRRSVTSPILE